MNRSPRMSQASSGGGRYAAPASMRASSRARTQSRPTAAPSAQAETPLRSVSVSQVRNASRYRSRNRSRKFLTGFIAVLVACVVLGVGSFALSSSGAFAIEQVTVTGAEHLSAEELTELAAVPAGSTLLNVDANGITTRLDSNPWVKSATIDRNFPSTLNLVITEREISAVVEVTVDDNNTTETWALSSDGMWITKIPDRDSDEGKAMPDKVFEDADAALHITDIPYGSTPEAGSYCTNANVENALGVIDGMTTELADQVKSVAAASSDSTTLTLQNGVEIAFGDTNNIRDKERVCLQLMQEHPDQISYINVRSVNKPSWRSL